MRYLGVDWGLKKVGLALSEGNLASPLKNYSMRSFKEGLAILIQEIKRQEIDLIVVGCPESGESKKLVESLVKELAKLNYPVKVVEETLSTYQAKHIAKDIGLGQQVRQTDDALAATIILQNFLDEIKNKA